MAEPAAYLTDRPSGNASSHVAWPGSVGLVWYRTPGDQRTGVRTSSPLIVASVVNAWARLRPRRSAMGCSGEQGQGADAVEGDGEARCPGPPVGQAQDEPTAPVHEPAREGD